MSRTYKRYTHEEDLQIARLIAEGKTVKAIASIMEIRYDDVKNRVKVLKKSTNSVSTPHMIAKLMQWGKISPEF
jgi:DNA-binding CsgD family transcriptional regulator